MPPRPVKLSLTNPFFSHKTYCRDATLPILQSLSRFVRLPDFASAVDFRAAAGCVYNDVWWEERKNEAGEIARSVLVDEIRRHGIKVCTRLYPCC